MLPSSNIRHNKMFIHYLYWKWAIKSGASGSKGDMMKVMMKSNEKQGEVLLFQNAFAGARSAERGTSARLSERREVCFLPGQQEGENRHLPQEPKGVGGGRGRWWDLHARYLLTSGPIFKVEIRPGDEGREPSTAWSGLAHLSHPLISSPAGQPFPIN